MPTPLPSGFSFEAVWLRYLAFEDPPVKTPGKKTSGISLTVEVAPVGDDTASVLLTLELQPQSADDQRVLKAKFEGVYRALDDQAKARLPEFASRQGGALLLPFVRELIANVTIRSQSGPLLLPPLNVSNLTEEKAPANKEP